MKKNSITKRLTLTNVLIVVLSLLIFFTIVLIISNGNALRDIQQQLIIENRVANTLYYNSKIEQAAVYKVLSDSINLVYIKTDDGLSLEYSSEEDFPKDLDAQKLVLNYVQAKKKVMHVNVGTEGYLCTLSTDRQNEEKADSVIISLISMKSIRLVTRKFTIALIISIAALSLVSVVVTYLISRRISKPIVELTNVAKQYEQRNFDAGYIANTNDELEDLSLAVSSMAKSIKEHDSEKNRLFRHISHEIKTPLTSIYGYAEGIKNNIFEDKDKPLYIIMSESLRIKKLTENLLFLSKLESNIEAFSFKETGLSAILEKAINSIESVALLSDIDIDYIPRQLPPVTADEDKLLRAFVNILSNCTKYAKSLISITAEEKDSSIEMVFKDDGQGFDSEAIENLLSGIAREKSNGSGLGLSIVNEIVKAHGGNFLIGNNTGGGAYFKIVLKKDFTPPLI